MKAVPDPETIVVRLKPDSLDDIPLGVLRIDAAGRTVYANRAAAAMAGEALQLGVPLDGLDFDAASRERLAAEREIRRATERGGAYPMTLRRSDTGTRVTLQVTAVPEYDVDGRMRGSAAFLIDTTMAEVNRTIHAAIGEACHWRDLLSVLDATLRDVVGFDTLMITLVARDRKSLRLIYVSPQPETADESGWRWWPMSKLVLADLDGLERTRCDDVDAMFAREPYRGLERHDEATRAWRALGYRQLLRRPVLRDRRLVAIVSASRLARRPFTAEDVERLDQLPIGEAVNMALALEREQELRFGLDLIRRLGAVAASIRDVAQVLVDELRAHFGWPHVSLFRVDRDRGVLTLVHQSAAATALLPEGYAQPIGTGLLGQVVATGLHVRLDNVEGNEVYVEGVAGTRSEMCLPVPGLEMRWILNAESDRLGGFASEERKAVEPLLDVAGLILDRTGALEFKSTVLESMADAVIQTTSSGEITSVNRAGERLLGSAPGALIGTHLGQLISAPGNDPDPPQFTARFIAAHAIKPAEVELLPSAGKPIPVLISGNSLPEQIGGKVYVASDLRGSRQLQRMHALRDVFRQVASEIRVPIALASTYLEQLATDPAHRELLDKPIKQLRRADLPLERVIRLAAAEEVAELPSRCIELNELSRSLLADLPDLQRAQTLVEPWPAPARVRASLQELSFCFNNLLAFLLRMKAEQDRVAVAIRVDGRVVVWCLGLVHHASAGPSATRLEARSEGEREFALAEPVIRSLMDRMRGSFGVEAGTVPAFELRLERWNEDASARSSP